MIKLLSIIKKNLKRIIFYIKAQVDKTSLLEQIQCDISTNCEHN